MPDCFNGAMIHIREIAAGRKDDKKCWVQVNNTAYVGMFEIAKLSPDLLHAPSDGAPNSFCAPGVNRDHTSCHEMPQVGESPHPNQVHK